MLAVVGFQAGEVPLQPVGCSRDFRVVEVVEHIGQSVQKHAACAFYIAEDSAGFFAGCHFNAVPGFPCGDVVEK